MRDTRFDCNLARRGDADPSCLYVEHFQQCIIVLIEQDGGASLRAQLHSSAYVIDVGVGDDDLFYYQVVLTDDGENILNIVARIDDHGFASGFVANDRAVTLQRTYGKDLVNHALQFSLSERKSATERRSEEVRGTRSDCRCASNHRVLPLQSDLALLTYSHDAAATCPVV